MGILKSFYFIVWSLSFVFVAVNLFLPQLHFDVYIFSVLENEAIFIFLQGDKDKKIEELTMELERQDQLCASYREKLLSFMNNVEEQTQELSEKIQVIIENLRKVESEVQKNSSNGKSLSLT